MEHHVLKKLKCLSPKHGVLHSFPLRYFHPHCNIRHRPDDHCYHPHPHPHPHAHPHKNLKVKVWARRNDVGSRVEVQLAAALTCNAPEAKSVG